MNPNLIPWADSHLRSAVVYALDNVLFVSNSDLEADLLHQTEVMYNEAQAAYRNSIADDDSATAESLYSIFSHIELDAKVYAGRVEELFNDPKFYKACHDHAAVGALLLDGPFTDALDALEFWHKVQAIAAAERVYCYINQLTQGASK